jgi:hypothetical protein
MYREQASTTDQLSAAEAAKAIVQLIFKAALNMEATGRASVVAVERKSPSTERFAQ